MEEHTLMTRTELAPANTLQRVEAAVSRAHIIQLIDTREDYSSAGDSVKELAGIVKAIGDARKELTQPLDAAKKNIMAQEKAVLAPVNQELERLKGIMAEYKEAEERRIFAEEAERRQAIADAAVAASMGFKQETPVMPLVEVASKSAGATTFKTWEFEVTDERAVPRELCSPDPKKIRAWLDYFRKMGTPVTEVKAPGLAITEKTGIRVK